MNLTYALLNSRQYTEALELTTTTIQRALSADQDHKPYDDIKSKLIWVIDNRARALEGLGRWDEAVQQLKMASRRPEGDDLNVSQTINLAELYGELGRAKEALEAIEQLGDMSPYGRMQLEAVRHTVAIELGDEKSAAAALMYMREHRTDALITYQGHLLQAEKLDEAAALLISRLEDPGLRNDALIRVQTYSDSLAPPLVMQWRARWQEFLTRPDVRAEINRVGKIEHYRLASPLQ